MTKDNRANDPAPGHGCCWWNCITLLDQYLAPHHLLGRLVYSLTRVRAPWLKDRLIRWFIRRYRVELSEVSDPDPRRYPDFNAFFTRPLAPGARPIVDGPRDIACPVDSLVSQAGRIAAGRLFQAKGHYYDVKTLLGGSEDRAATFRTGCYATLYLSPRDYHRVHMPVGGRLRRMTYIPGRLFSVSPRTTRAIPRLFTRNERLVTIFDTEAGPMALVMVGAMCVAGIETVWTGAAPLPHSRTPQEWDYGDSAGRPTVILSRGAEMGRFNMGSTVIVLFAADHVMLARSLVPETTLRMGQLLGTWNTLEARSKE